MKFQFHWPGIRGMWVSSNGWNVERGESYVRGGLVLAPWKVLEGYWYLVVDGGRAARIGLKGLGMYSSAYTFPVTVLLAIHDDSRAVEKKLLGRLPGPSSPHSFSIVPIWKSAFLKAYHPCLAPQHIARTHRSSSSSSSSFSLYYTPFLGKIFQTRTDILRYEMVKFVISNCCNWCLYYVWSRAILCEKEN